MFSLRRTAHGLGNVPHTHGISVSLSFALSPLTPSLSLGIADPPRISDFFQTHQLGLTILDTPHTLAPIKASSCAPGPSLNPNCWIDAKHPLGGVAATISGEFGLAPNWRARRQMRHLSVSPRTAQQASQKPTDPSLSHMCILSPHKSQPSPLSHVFEG